MKREYALYVINRVEYTLPSNHFFCNSSHVQLVMENGDTTTANDLVAQQYEDLPYPKFGLSKILKEEIHYEIDNESPVTLFLAHTLEKHNHYLHRGHENFQ